MCSSTYMYEIDNKVVNTYDIVVKNTLVHKYSIIIIYLETQKEAIQNQNN